MYISLPAAPVALLDLGPHGLVEALEGRVVGGEEGQLLARLLQPLHESGLPQRRRHAPQLEVVLDDVAYGKK